MDQELWKKIKGEKFDPYNWNETTNIYSKSIQVPVVRGCNGYTATNIGDTTVQINGKTLFPSATPASILGDSITLGGNLGELYKGDLSIQFVSPANANPKVEIIQKFYIAFD
jgi:hypothetical protein